MSNLKNRLLLLALLTIIVLACNAALPPSVPTAASTLPPIPGADQTQAALPRITAEEAKAAVDSGQAIIIDVRATEAFLQSHIAGAVSIPLTQIEDNPARVTFDKSQWIITYCT
jgi:3-mercaptopyruvate sulfurtransferase SseA